MGQVMVGEVVSILFTLNEQVAVFPLPSLAVNTTVEVPTLDMVLPDVGDCETVAVPQLSEVVNAV